ncbi:MAG: class I SAM-dependent methyltransferase [Ferruginibacter sp.]
MIHYNNCPVCGSSEIQQQLTATDHTVSGKQFAIWHCNACTARFTQDIPELAGIGEFYKSENYISHSDTKKGFINSLYHLVRNRTLAAKRKLLIKQTGLLKASLLDIGCGTGAFLNDMKQHGWAVAGLEPDETARGKAKELYGLEPLSIEELFNQPTGSFNAITMWHVLEHVHDLHGYMDQLKRILAPAGKIFIAVPNYTSYDATIYGSHWAAYDVPRHLYHFSPTSMKLLVEQHGLKLDLIKPMWFDSYYVSMLSEQYKNGKGSIVRAFWNGLMSNKRAWSDKTRCSSEIYIISK